MGKITAFVLHAVMILQYVQRLTGFVFMLNTSLNFKQNERSPKALKLRKGQIRRLFI